MLVIHTTVAALAVMGILVDLVLVFTIADLKYQTEKDKHHKELAELVLLEVDVEAVLEEQEW